MSERPSHHSIDRTPSVTFAEAIGPVMRLEDASRLVKRSDGNDGDLTDMLVVLQTTDGTMVCPTQQFVEDIDQNGNTVYHASSHVAFGWKISRLSGQSDWTSAAGFFYPRAGEESSYADILKDPGVDREDKIKLFKKMFASESERAGWLGADETFRKLIEDNFPPIVFPDGSLQK